MDIQKVKAAIFDLDGTLLDTLGDIGTAANEALCRYDLPAHPISEYRNLVGHGIRTLFRQAVPANTPEAIYEKALSFYLGYYPEHCIVHTAYFPGVQDFLKKLEARGIRLAVISNKTEATSHKIISHFFPETQWAFVWGNNGSRPLKPALDAGRLACGALELKPEEILYVGDGDTDMEFASQMGFIAAGVTWGYRDPDVLLAAGADFLSASFQELEEKLGLT